MTNSATLFNSYYNAAGDRILRANRGNITRPSVKEVYAYRRYVDEAMIAFLANNTNPEIQALVTLGLNHEQQHQELLITDIKHTLGHNPTFPVYHKDVDFTSAKNKTFGTAAIPGGIYEIGFQGDGFCYDNELRGHKVYLNDFEIDKALITNGQYLEFMQDQGYQRAELWLDEGWTWVNQHQIHAPLYWHRIDDEWHHYTLAGLQKIDPDAILCHISFYEAAAFAEWQGMRLPTEFEWEIAADQLDWGKRWEWTYSAYLPYPGFKKAAGAIGEYNGKFMINQMVLRGASTATSPKHSRTTYRNFFHAPERWQFTGLRLIHS